ncbi:unnamed protein product [Rangifer tarandus platyrhynchus]|uniref:Uncharacterized protein n=2 Tax=Rangifer tarandus platyrhynchus TaxID=3082113 RepID=A0ABN8XND1_RANTA|nr:unnamed protein product [Rangifer tarandus platyrhynchus]
MLWLLHSYRESCTVLDAMGQLCAHRGQKLCLVAQSCLILDDPVDCSPPDSSVHGILQARTLELVAIPFFQGLFPTQGSNHGLWHYRRILYHLSHQGSPQGKKQRNERAFLDSAGVFVLRAP